MQRFLAVVLFGFLRPGVAERIDTDEFDLPPEESLLQRDSRIAKQGAVSEPNGLEKRTQTAGTTDEQDVDFTYAKKLKVAFAVIAPYGVKEGPDAWTDSFAVLSHSIRKAEAKSPHDITLLAILPDGLTDPDKHERALAKLGWEAHVMKVPVSLQEVPSDFAREALGKVLGEKEELKYYGAALTEYDRVVMMDGDTMLLKPIDELFELSPKPGIVGTYDYEMDIAGSNFPPMNSGFGVFTPHKADFIGLGDVFREGDFTGLGFRHSGTGYTYGAGSQGMLSFFYNQWRPGSPGVDKQSKLVSRGNDLPMENGFNGSVQPPESRFYPVDRSMYDVIQTPSLLEAVDKGYAGADRVKVFHFAGACTKPWMCNPLHAEICVAMQDAWWQFRKEVREDKGLPAAQDVRCKPYKTEYKPLDGLIQGI